MSGMHYAFGPTLAQVIGDHAKQGQEQASLSIPPSMDGPLDLEAVEGGLPCGMGTSITRVVSM